MKKRIPVILLLTVMVGIAIGNSIERPTATPSVVPDELRPRLANVTPDTQPTDNSESGEASSSSSAYTSGGTTRASMNTPTPADPPRKIETVAKLPPKQAPSEGNYKEYPYRALLTPNDPGVQSSYVYNHLQLPSAWNVSTGAPITVAVIDSGFALNHEDLQASWHINSGETGIDAEGKDKRSNGVDDDNNGYVDDWRGWDFYGHWDDGLKGYVRDNDPSAGTVNPAGRAVEHGTEVAGLIGATANNGKGIAGFNWNVRVMPLQALSDNGDGITSDVTRAILYAVNNGAKIINLSLGGDVPDRAVTEAVNYAHSNGVLVVAAAGNCGQGCLGADGQTTLPPGTMSYPALDEHVVAVGAVDETGARASFSSYGPGIDIVAPGSVKYTGARLISTTWDPANQTSLYTNALYGTSFSTPIVSSLAALIMGTKPTATPDEVTAYLAGTATKLAGMNGALFTPHFGHGRANALSATTPSTSLVAGDSLVLAQTGSHLSEHTFDATSPMSSGCATLPGAYCTIRLANLTNGFERFLPYKQADTSGNVGWNWNANILANGEWSARAMSGSVVSDTPYYLFGK